MREASPKRHASSAGPIVRKWLPTPRRRRRYECSARESYFKSFEGTLQRAPGDEDDDTERGLLLFRGVGLIFDCIPCDFRV
jgi:hypothetical protein